MDDLISPLRCYTRFSYGRVQVLIFAEGSRTVRSQSAGRMTATRAAIKSHPSSHSSPTGQYPELPTDLTAASAR